MRVVRIKELNFCACQKYFPRVPGAARLAVIFKSSLFAIRNGWFGHSNNQRLACVTTWKASGQRRSRSHNGALTISSGRLTSGPFHLSTVLWRRTQTQVWLESAQIFISRAVGGRAPALPRTSLSIQRFGCSWE